MTKSYDEMMRLPTYDERLKYLQLDGRVSELTFGGHRYLNQKLYSSPEWKCVRRKVIIRDNGCDLNDADRPIYDKVLIHHINPITVEDVLNRDPSVFDMDNLVCVSNNTHQAIHYSRPGTQIPTVIERRPNDTAPWKA